MSLLLSAACGGGGGTTASDVVQPDGDGTKNPDGDAGDRVIAPPGFDDHCVQRVETEEAYFEQASDGDPPQQLKFVLTDFGDEEGGPTFLMDADFYSLHDEWYWYRLLNGVAVPRLDTEEDQPVDGLGPYETIQEI